MLEAAYEALTFTLLFFGAVGIPFLVANRLLDGQWLPDDIFG